MKLLLIFFILFIFQNCSKPHTVLICGDHICVNKKEAQQHFEENLSIEVQIIDKKNENKADLVQLNLKNDNKRNKQISIQQKNSTNKKVKILTNNEIKKIKEKIKLKEKKQTYAKKVDRRKKNNVDKNPAKKITKINKNKNLLKKKKTNVSTKNIVDVCTIIEKCSIDEISKYLLGQSKKKRFPDITIRE